MGYYTYQDSLDHALDYIGGNPGDIASRDTRRAVLNAYRILATEHNWSYYYKHGRIQLWPMWNKGTVQFQKTSGLVGTTPTANLWTLTGVLSGPITNATSTTPIIVSSPNHQLFSGQSVQIAGVQGQAGANGTFEVSYIDVDTFLLNGSTTNGVYSDNAGTQQGRWYLAGATILTVTGATNTNPIVITTSAPHGLTTGAIVVVQNVLGQLGANGTFTVTVTGPTTLQLNGSVDYGVAYYDNGDPLLRGQCVPQDGTSIQWPPFASEAYIRVGLVVFMVDRVIDNVHLTTMWQLSPSADMPPGTGYKIYQDSYLMPADFSSTGQMLYERNFGGMTYVHVDEWLRQNRFVDQMGEPRWYCVPEDHEILTKRGWKRHDDLVLGEDVLAYDVNDGELSWCPLQDVSVFDYDGELCKLERAYENFLCTSDHRWPVEIFKSNKVYRSIVETRDFDRLPKLTMIPRTGDFCGYKSILPPRLAAILGWLVTDGTGIFSKSHWDARVYQSEKKFLGEVVGLLGTKACPSKGAHVIRVAKEDRKAIRDVIRSKSELPTLVCQLSRDAAEAMFDAMFKAEGSISRCGQRTFTQWTEDNEPVIEAFQILALLTGRSTSIRRNKAGGLFCSILNRKTIRPSRYGGFKTEWYTGKIWCPRTEMGTWVMRHEGCPIVTGNSIVGSVKHPGRECADVFPYPGFLKTIDFMYRRIPRPLQISNYSTGTVALTSGSTTVTLSVGLFSSMMVGSVLRVSSVRGTLPTSPLGANPATFESVIATFIDSQTVLVQDAPSFSISGASYVVSDIVDVESDSMLAAFERGIEMQIAITRVMKDRPNAAAQYEMALKKAKAADSVSFQGRVVGQQDRYRQRLARMPITWTTQ